LENRLGSEDFAVAHVAEAEAKPVETPPGVTPEVEAETEKWVSLEFPVELGERITFGFRGNKRLSASDLNEIVDDQRELGFGKDFVRDIQASIKEKYRSLGYAHVEVE